MSKEVLVIFMSTKSKHPKGLDESWDEILGYWHEFKLFTGSMLPGLYLLVGDKAIGGVNHELKKDPSSKRKVMDKLRSEGLEPEIIEQSPF